MYSTDDYFLLSGHESWYDKYIPWILVWPPVLVSELMKRADALLFVGLLKNVNNLSKRQHERIIRKLKKAHEIKPYHSGDMMWGEINLANSTNILEMNSIISKKRANVAARLYFENFLSSPDHKHYKSAWIFTRMMSFCRKNDPYLKEAIQFVLNQHQSLIESCFSYGLGHYFVVDAESFEKVVFLASLRDALGPRNMRSFLKACKVCPDKAEEYYHCFSEHFTFSDLQEVLQLIPVSENTPLVQRLLDPKLVRKYRDRIGLIDLYIDVLPANRPLLEKLKAASALADLLDQNEVP